MFWIVGADAIGGALHHLRGGPALHALAGQMEHVAWEGFHFYDLIFPLFVFMVGAAVPLSLDKLVAQGGRAAAWRRLARRTLLLFALGVFYYGGIGSEPRLLGVLQRLALCYGATSVLYLWLRPRGLTAVFVALLAGYWALLTFVPVPRFGAGDFREGHNLTNWIDAHWLPLRKWNGDHDPEGLLSTLPAIATCLLGVFASKWLTDATRSARGRVGGLAGAGVVLVALGWLWGAQFPVIKNLWTSSFVLVAGGWSLLLLAAFYQVIDVWRVQGWARPFLWVGANSLLIYLVSNVVDFAALSARFAGGPVAAWLDARWAGLGGLVLALVGAGLAVGFCGWLHRRGIFLRI
ncbi:acyltransferase family protein [Oleiharenicola sp. Vm1]|uniref:acyltransferase family protein n=1 Tax=Oleiharenicola sp. Vm1 TaxID=3398393 RepID=UPI0039F56B85